MANGAFTRFQTSDIITSVDSSTGTVWSGNQPRLSKSATSSLHSQSNAAQYFTQVYQTSSTLTEAAVQFAIAYGDEAGSGSLLYNSLVSGFSPSSTLYGQYQNIVLGDDVAPFVFGDNSSSYFYALSIERARYKESLALGVLSLTLSGSITASITLTDNSSISSGNVYGNAGRVYQLVSGSEGVVFTGVNSNGFTTTAGSYGLFLPDVGLIILNGKALDLTTANQGISLGTVRTSNVANQNPSLMFNAISRSLADSKTFRLNSQETLSSDYYFVRAQNSEFNYSSNPSFVSGSTGQLLHPTMQNNPQTFITSVGLYNDSNELCAVAKLSRPLIKDFTKELLVRVKLDY